MFEVISMRDVEKSAGMFYTHHMFREDRENQTAMEMLMQYLTMIAGGADMSEYEKLLWRVADHHATLMMKAVEDVEEYRGRRIPDGRDRDFSIKQAVVMIALAEISTVLEGSTWDEDTLGGTTLKDINEDNINIELSKVTAGLSPDMLSGVAEGIVKNSYPDEKPTHDILVALWVEGAMVAVMADDICRFMQECENELWEKYVALAKSKFIVTD